MGEYATKDDDDKWIASDGKKYKTRSGAWKWSKKLEEKSNPPPVETESISESEIDDPSNDDNTPNYNYSEPDWIIDDIDGSSDNQEFVPGILKRIKPASERRGKRSKKEIEADQQTNGAILKVAYKSGDHLLTRYKRMMLDDKNAEAVTHSEEDYDWITTITNEALEHNGFNIGAAIGPNQIAILANGYWFSAPVYKINKESSKSPFKGALGGRMGRILEKVPFIGKRIKRSRNPVTILHDKEGSKNDKSS